MGGVIYILELRILRNIAGVTFGVQLDLICTVHLAVVVHGPPIDVSMAQTITFNQRQGREWYGVAFGVDALRRDIYARQETRVTTEKIVGGAIFLNYDNDVLYRRVAILRGYERT